jgi:hypothetical protein
LTKLNALQKNPDLPLSNSSKEAERNYPALNYKNIFLFLKKQEGSYEVQ